jgi:hypothetical protein
MRLVESIEEPIFYHGTSTPSIDKHQLRASVRGFFGPGVYLSAQPSVARSYGDYLHPATVRGNIFQAWANRRGTLETDPIAHDKIISGLSNEDKARVLSLKSWYGQDSEAFYQALSRKASPEAARDALRHAGYDGIEGIGDGHEICVFDPHNVTLHPAEAGN